MHVKKLIKVETRQWDASKIWEILPKEVPPKILQIARVPTNDEDKLIWALEKSGKYNVRSTYRMVFKHYTAFVGESSIHLHHFWR